jgi:hypoxanthine phosphoribosyltransferase
VLLERRLDRQTARAELVRLDREDRERRRRRFGRGTMRSDDADLTINVSTMDTDAAGEAIEAAARAAHVPEAGLLSASAQAQIQFRVRVELSRHGMSPPDLRELKRTAFVHPSEETFARLLDFYRIAWEYEPKSFPIQWDRDGKITEAFTPDFYLPEFDLYLELTTMKQAHVTKKNRKIKLVKQLYPHVNIQVFYQKDFENLIFKHGLSDRALPSPEAVRA